NITSVSRTQTTTLLHSDTQAIDEDFVMTNYSQLEPLVRRRMRELRLQGVVTRLEYSSEDVDEEMQMECPPGFQLQPQINTENQGMQNKSPFLVAHLRDTEGGGRRSHLRKLLLSKVDQRMRGSIHIIAHRDTNNLIL
ncbi:hypothetical protein Tco_1128048, partial [Tanacetum coccineum]